MPDPNNELPPIVPDESGESESSEGATIKLPDGKGGFKLYTQEEAAAYLERATEKERGADAKLREAAELRKSVESQQRMLDDWEAANKGDIEAIRRLPSYPKLNISEKQAKDIIAKLQERNIVEPETEEQSYENRPLTVDDLPEEVTHELKESKKLRLERIREETFKHLDAALDEDEIVGDKIRRKSEGFKRRLRDHARTLLNRRAVAAATTTRDWKPSKIDFIEIAKEARSWIEDIDGEEASVNNSYSVPGSSLGKGPSAGGTPLHRSKNSIKRPKTSDDAAYGDYLLRKAEQIADARAADNFGG